MQLPRRGQAIWVAWKGPENQTDCTIWCDMHRSEGKARDKLMLISVKKEAPLLTMILFFR
jgi:hypothetical protein